MSFLRHNVWFVLLVVLIVIVIGFNGLLLQEIPIKQTNIHSVPMQYSKQKSEQKSKHVSTDITLAPKYPVVHDLLNKNQIAVRNAMKWAWKGYKEHAYGSDVLDIQNMKGTIWNGYDLGLTLIDSLDTLYIMNMDTEFNQAIHWIETEFPAKLAKPVKVNLFETTIRILGSLLTAYHFTSNKKLLDIAEDLGNRLACAFDSKSRVPFSDVDLGAKTAAPPSWGMSSLSEVSTIQLEFKQLSHLTGIEKYGQQADHVMDLIDQQQKAAYPDGVLPIYISASTGKLQQGVKTLGARGDSYYEYLLKQWLLTGKKERKYKERYELAIKGIMENLVMESFPSKLVFLGEISRSGKQDPKMDHLVCFMPGLLALGYQNGMPESHFSLAKQLMYTCYQMYKSMASGLAPEIVRFNLDKRKTDDIIVSHGDDFNLLRPETVESLMILYRITEDEKYRDWGKEIFDAFERHCKLPNGGYTTIIGVHSGNVRPRGGGIMESFFLAETLKYLYLLFSDDTTYPKKYPPLDQYVFNTEAHPLPIWKDKE